MNSKIKHARLSEDFTYIIDSDDQRVEYDDPRVVHVWTIDTSSYTKRIMEKVYERKGRKLRTVGDTNTEIIQYAKKICSGRECVPMASMAGSTVKDITDRKKKGEITIYLTLDEPGPCQNGAWPEVWETFAKRLNIRNAVFGVWPYLNNNYLGLGKFFPVELGKSVILGDFFEEARNTLACLAQNKDQAMEIFDIEFERFIICFSNNGSSLKSSLDRWAFAMSKIPLTAGVEETPKVLIFGGLNVTFIHYPITEYFIRQGIIPKLVDISEGMIWLRSQPIVRYGFTKGLIHPEAQFSLPRLIISRLFETKHRAAAALALSEKFRIILVDLYMKWFRKIMKKSGLLFDTHIPFSKIAAAGHAHITFNGFTETTITTGRYICSAMNGVYDGLVNLGCFNCQPAMNSQAIIRSLASKRDTPYIAIDCEGPWISTNQKRLLEALAVQAKRRREKKNGCQ